MSRHTESNYNEHLAKINRPRLSRYYPRQRLFKKLDEARHNGLVWISAPAGSGKTILAASYLKQRGAKHVWYQIDARDSDPATFFYYLRRAAGKLVRRKQEALPLLTAEYLLGLSTFTRNFFEKFYARVKSPWMLVFDNFQDLPQNSALQGLWGEALGVIPRGVTVIILSRSDPPAQLARLVVGQTMVHLNEQALQLDLDETRGLAALQKEIALSPQALVQLHEMARGWAAGVTLMLEAGARAGEDFDFKAAEHAVLFDYFATEIFQRTEPELQRFMLETAIFPQFSADMARTLTGNHHAGEILGKLAHSNYFTLPLPGHTVIYQYHPLFREFLLTLARRQFKEIQFQTLQKRAAQALLEAGDREGAAPLLVEVHDWEALDRTIRPIAESLMHQGRHLTLLGWLQLLPEAEFENYPWLCFWLATGWMPLDPERSRNYYILSLEAFLVQDQVDGIFFSWAGIVDTIIHQQTDIRQLDIWIEKLDRLLTSYGRALPDPIEAWLSPRIFAALVFRQPRHPDLGYWCDKATRLLETGRDPSLRMLTGFYLLGYCLWTGDRYQAAHVVANLTALAASKTASPLTQIIGRLGEAWYGWATGDHAACHAAVADGLAIAAQSGVHVWSYILKIEACVSALITCDMPHAAKWLEEFALQLDKARLLDKMYYYHDCAWQALLLDDTTSAYHRQTKALAMARQLGAVYCEAEAHYGMFHVCHAKEDFSEALRHIKAARQLGDLFGGGTMAFQCDMAEAQYFLSLNRTEEGLAALGNALKRVSAHGHVAFSWWRRDVMSRLCALALTHGIETQSACRIIRQHRLPPDPSSAIPDAWPWSIKIQTLGGFSVEVDGEPLTFSGKAQKKPLELLQAIISLSTHEVPEQQIADELWPDSDGDLARQSLRTTISRLRRLLRYETAVTTGGGKIGIDRQLVWVDVWQFEGIVDHCISLLTSGNGTQEGTDSDRLCETLERFHGQFLPGCDQSWALPMREHVRNRYLSVLMRIGDWLETQGRIERAIGYYQKGVEIDPLIEALYQRLIICYGTLGRGAEAMRIYNRCEEVLSSQLGISPSRQTRNLLKSHLNN